MALYDVNKLMVEARKLAAQYKAATGKSLGISSEIAKFDVARLMDLELCESPHSGGYDAIGHGDREGKRIQIKGRAVFDDKKTGQRIGQLKIEQEWDSIMMVMMDEQYEPVEIREAEREDIIEAIKVSEESKRSKRGAMSVAKFKNISRLVWTREEGVIKDEIWENQPG